MSGGHDDMEIKYLAFGRREDKVMVASYAAKPDPSGFLAERTKTVLERGKWATMEMDRLSLEDKGNVFYVLLDDRGRVFFAVASKAYPSRLIFRSSSDTRAPGLLHEFRDMIREKYDGVSMEAKPGAIPKGPLRELAAKYNDLDALDRLSRVKGMVDGLREEMQGNVELALKNTDRMEEVEGHTEELAESAQRFRRSAADVERMMWWRMWKMRCAIFFIIVVILGYIIIPIVIDAQKDK